MILTFDNKFDQIDEADCMFIFQIKHQYSFWIIAHILFNAGIVTGFKQIFMTLCDLDPDTISNDIIITFLV